MLTFCGSGMRDLAIIWEMGKKVSKPFAMVQGRPFFFASSWTLRAVMSIARRYAGRVMS